MDKTYTVEELDALNLELLTFLDSKQLTPPAAALIAVGLLLSVIRACKSETGRVPSALVRLEPMLDEVLRQGVPVITTPLKERISTAMKAGRTH